MTPASQALKPLLDGFLQSLALSEAAVNTVAGYQSGVRQFCAFLAERGDEAPLEGLTAGHVKAWLAWLKGRGIAASTRNRHLTALKQFWKWLVEEAGALPVDFLAAIDGAKTPRGLPRPMTEEQIARFLHAPNVTNWQGRCDQAVLELLYGSGLRISEACNVEFRDLDRGNPVGPMLRLVGKGDKEAVVPVSKAFLQALDSYLEFRGQGGPREKVFLNYKGRKKLSDVTFRQRFKKYLVKAGIPEDFTPHKLRHSCATHLLDHGADIRAVQELLRHENLNTTAIYTKVSNKRMVAAYQAAHPRDKM